MKQLLFLAALLPSLLSAEVRTLRLREALDLAVRQSPDVLLARFDDVRSQQALRIARDPFVPKVFAGSGLAWTYGFPMSIEGSAPSIVQVRAVQSIFNKPQMFNVARAREEARGSQFLFQQRREEALLRTTALFLDAERARRVLTRAKEQVATLGSMERAAIARVEEGRAIPLERRQASVTLARARQRVTLLEDEAAHLEHSLAVTLGLPAEDRVQPAEEERALPPLPANEEDAVRSALDSSFEVRKLQSDLIARGFDIRSAKAARLPRMDLVAQYGLFARFNNFEQYFNRFQRHNSVLGASFQIPLLAGPAASAQAAQAEAESARLRIQMNNTRNRIRLETVRLWKDVEHAREAHELANMDLELAREQTTILLAQLSEGRATQKQIDEARFLENEKWIVLSDAALLLERARYAMLNQTGSLSASLLR
jgi:outer membrane protein